MAKFTIAIILGLFAVSALSYTIHHPTFKMDPALLEVPKASSKVNFGDILALIQSGEFIGSDERIYEFIDSMRKDIKEEAARHLKTYQDQQKDCQEEKVFRRKEISDAEDSAIAARAKAAECAVEAKTAVTLHNLAKSAIAYYKKRESDLTKVRNEQHATYVANKADLEGAIKAIEAALVVVGEIETELAGTTISTNPTKTPALLQKMNSLLQVTVKARKGVQAFPIYAAYLAMTANKFNAADIDALRAKFEELKSNVEKALADVESTESKQLSAYNTEMARIAALIPQYEHQRDTAAAYQVTMNNCVATETNIAKLADAKEGRNKELLDAAVEVCNQNEIEYQKSVASRTNELKLLDQLEKAVRGLEKSYAKEVLPSVSEALNREHKLSDKVE